MRSWKYYIDICAIYYYYYYYYCYLYLKYPCCLCCEVSLVRFASERFHRLNSVEHKKIIIINICITIVWVCWQFRGKKIRVKVSFKRDNEGTSCIVGGLQHDSSIVDPPFCLASPQTSLVKNFKMAAPRLNKRKWVVWHVT